MADVLCGRCEKPVADQACLCDRCTSTLSRLLSEVFEDRAAQRAEPPRWPDQRDVPAEERTVPKHLWGAIRPGGFGSATSTPWDGIRRRLTDELEVARLRQARRRSPYEGGSGGRTATAVLPPAPTPLHRMAPPTPGTRRAPVSTLSGWRPTSAPRGHSADPVVLLEAWEAGRPWDERASRLLERLQADLRGWVLWTAELRGVSVPRDVGAAASARWLRGHLEWLRHREETPAALDALQDLVRAARRLVDVPADRWYAGPCTAERADHDVDDDDAARDRRRRAIALTAGGSVGERCGWDLYALPGHETVQCPVCGSEYPVESRREWLLTAAAEVLADATTIARALTAMGLPLKVDAIWKWRERGLLEVRAQDGRRPLYRVGDVRDLFTSTLARTGRPPKAGE